MNINQNLHTSQQKHLRSNTIHPWMELDPVGELKKYTYLKRKLFNTLMWMGRVWHNTEPSQQYLANKLGCTRKTVNVLIKDLLADGVLSYVYRHRRTCVYYVHDFFRQPHIRKKLKFLLPAIVTIGLSLGLLASKSYPPMLHHINRDFILNSLTRYHSLTIPIYAPLKRESINVNETLPTIKGINLTRYGQIKLCPYPKEALAEAEKSLLKRGNVERPMGYITKVCKEWCRKNNIEPNWSKMYRLLEEGNFAHDEKEIDTSSTLKASLTVRESRTEDSPQEKQRGNSVHLKPLSFYQQRDETIQHYNPGKGFKEEIREPEDPELACEKIIVHYQKNPQAAHAVGLCIPWWKACTEEQQSRLLLKYPFIADYIDKQKAPAFIKDLADRIVEYNKTRNTLQK